MSEVEKNLKRDVSFFACFGGVALAVIGAVHIGSAAFIEESGWVHLGITELIVGASVAVVAAHVNWDSE